MIYRYKESEKFEKFDKPDFQDMKEIVLWGAGKIGGVAAHCLKKMGVKIAAFCDVAKDKWETEFCGCKVISPADLMNSYRNASVVITNVFHTTVYYQLKEMGFQNVYDATSLFMEIDFEGYDFWMTTDYAIRNVEQYLAAVYHQKTTTDNIDQIFLNITTKCSLRCKHCSMFIPYVEKPCHYDSNIILEDFHRVLDCLGHVRIVNFYGGEPLLHPNLPQMLRSLKEEKRIERISIITNGTLVPSEELIQVMKEDGRFWVRISDYGTLSSKINQIKQILDENDIFYEVTNYAYWDEPSKIAPVKNTESELITKFTQCVACNVMFILNRKACICSTASAVSNLNGFPVPNDSYVDLTKYDENKENLKTELKEFIDRMRNGKYFNACRFCSGNHCIQFENKVPVALQTKELLKFDYKR